jgi:DNA-3-methyladenine glycosylase I
MSGDRVVAASPLPEGITVGDDGVARCWWGAGDPLYRPYHDEEWGRPVADDRRLFEKLSLEGFQAGLSWLTILRKREHFRRAFASFDPAAVARFGDQQVERLLADPGIVRNRAKIEATINNARRYAELATEFGSLAAYVWRFEPGPRARPSVVDYATLLQLGHSPESRAMSKDLRRRGWSFVGPTTVYAFMQAMGLVNDHLEGCDRRPPVERERHRSGDPPSLPATPTGPSARPSGGAGAAAADAAVTRAVTMPGRWGTPPASPTATASPSRPGFGSCWRRWPTPARPSTRARRWPPGASPASGNRSCVAEASGHRVALIVGEVAEGDRAALTDGVASLLRARG